MTIQEIRDELKPVKPLSRERLYFYFRKFKIKPLSQTVRLKPQQYPQDTATRLRLKLGLLTPAKNQKLVFKLHSLPTAKKSRR